MMKVLVLSLLFIGCVSQQKIEADRQRELKRQALREEEARREKCDADPKCDVERKRAEAAHLREVNYPVTVLFTSKEHRAKFESVVCGTRGKSLKSLSSAQQTECNRKYTETYFAKLHEIYPLTPMEQVDTWCKANPVDCLELEKIEDQYRDSNAGMNSRYRDERNARQAAEERAHKAHILRAVSNALRGRQGSFCTTKQVGDSVYQECD